MTGEIPSGIDIQTFPKQEVSNETTIGDIDAIAWKFLLADASDTKTRAEALYERQTQQRNNTEERYQNACSDVRDTTCTRLWKTPEASESPSEKIAKAKHELYQTLGIKEWSETSDNLWKFKLWLADGLVGDNIQAVEELLKIGIDKVANALLQMFSSIDKIKDFVVVAGEQMLKDIQNLASLEPYDTGKSIGSLGLGVIWSIWKNLWKTATKEAVHIAKKEAVEKWVVDLLEWKWRYMLPMNTHPNIMREKMVEFAGAMDIKYLANNPERIGHMTDIVHHMSQYVIENWDKIRSLKKPELNAFKSDFMELYQSVTKVWNSPEIPVRSANSIKNIRDWDFQKAYYSLNPEFKPNPN